MPEFIYKIHDQVEIIPLGIKGRVVSLFYGGSEEEYKVRYFDNCTAKTEFFYADEIKPA